jgi:putative oxidoreductase
MSEFNRFWKSQPLVSIFTSTSLDMPLLILRFVNGLIFIAHGWEKLSDLGGFERGLAELGVPAAGILGTVVVLSETIGGLCLISGLLCRLAALSHCVIMVVAILLVHTPWLYGLTGERGMQFPLSLFAGSLVLLFTGAGAYSLSRVIELRSASPMRQAASASGDKINVRSFPWWLGVLLIPLIGGYWVHPIKGYDSQVETTEFTNIGREVLRAEQTAWSRLEQRDVKSFMELMDEDFTAFSGSMPRRLDTKKAEEDHARLFIEELGGRILEYKILDPRVQVFGQTAVLTYHFSTKVIIRGEQHSQSGKSTSVWVRRDKGWRQVHYNYVYNPNPT